MKSLDENETWILVDKSVKSQDCKKLNIIDSKWVFKKKFDKDRKYKARLVIRGFMDKYVYDIW